MHLDYDPTQNDVAQPHGGRAASDLIGDGMQVVQTRAPTAAVSKKAEIGRRAIRPMAAVVADMMLFACCCDEAS